MIDQALLQQHFPLISSKQLDQFSQLEVAFLEWNSKINMVSRKDTDELFTRHILHSLAIAKVFEFPNQSKILDVGTGGGFPGIPLAILFPNCHFHLVDSIGKKIKVVNDLIDQLALTHVSAEQIRAEKLKNKYHYVVSRAVTRLHPFYSWVHNKFEKKQLSDRFANGIFYLKGGDLEDEIEESGLFCIQHEIKDFFDNPFFETKKVLFVPGNQ
ncbi:MAG: 16S rRNA (guanine(527)-N(7))-methyltransferase RsmG [Cyclobacteriaceae bacterium]|nr:16S rRNA (guanine(527)-N(7))-methyltransferase RsmG [Cyclobacteriaceae bacterium]MCH8515588.1 16S rRNA (guanine(527)-N(7))-methyltransferase RsmG [Cyclobacteriaceae bacterium]